MAEPDLDDLIQATGLAVTLIGSLLEGAAKSLPRGEFSGHLANLAAVTEESSASQSAILKRWASLAAAASAVRPH